MEKNLLYYGDNLDVLRRHVPDESVDLIYLDPPFNSNADYNLLFEERGVKSAAQIRAFEDTWEWNAESSAAYEEVVEQGGEVANAMRAFRTLLGGSDMLAYLAMMAPRLIELHRALKPSGSLWLHCDTTASHYLKLVLDAVFGPQYFRNEVTWKRFNFRADAHRLGRTSDRLLFYTKSDAFTFNRQFVAYGDSYLASHFQKDPDGRLFTLDNLNPPGGRGPVYEFHGHTRPWRFTEEKMRDLEARGYIHVPSDGGLPRAKRYLDELKGQAVTDIWADIPSINSQAKERLGFPTQKPFALLERIIQLSSNPGDLVLDPFCGCGTALDAAEALKRRWIGIDVTHVAVGLIKSRLIGRYGTSITDTFKVIGEPTTVDDAAVLAREDPFQFQAWALGLIGARHAGETKKGADRGIDGRLFFHDEPSGGKSKQIIASVKAGHVTVSYVRDLWGVLNREEAEIGVLISFEEPTAPMRREAADAGFYESPWGKHPRIQLVTIAELLAGKRIDYPPANATFRQAQRAQQPEADTIPLPFEQG